MCKDYFATFGNVIATRGSFVPGRQNWIALQYESHLQATKAALQNHVEISRGIFCGVRAIDDNDPILNQSNSGGFKDIWGDEKSIKRQLLSSDGKDGLTEDDLLLGKKTDSDTPKKRNCCERFLFWVLQLGD